VVVWDLANQQLDGLVDHVQGLFQHDHILIMLRERLSQAKINSNTFYYFIRNLFNYKLYRAIKVPNLAIGISLKKRVVLLGVD